MTSNFLRLYQPSDGYLYNSDSLLLVDFARTFLAPHTLSSTHPLHKPRKSKTTNLIDIGAGCGIIGLLCAKHFGVRAHLIEINKPMATLAYINATTNSDCLPNAKMRKNLADTDAQNTLQDFAQNHAQKILQNLPQSQMLHNSTFCQKNADKPFLEQALASVYNIDFLDSSLPKFLPQMLSQNPPQSQIIQNLAPKDAQNPSAQQNPQNPKQKPKKCATKADFCISNPPFYPDGALRSNNPNLLQARYATAMPLEKWIPQAKRVLAPRGGLIFCYHPSELPRVFITLKNSGFAPEILRLVYPLPEREASLALIYARLDSRAVLKIAPPLFTHISNGKNHAKQEDFTPEVAQIYATYRTHSIKTCINDIDTD